MASPPDRRYKDTHEWHKPVDGLVVVGLSRFAVDELTDVTYVEVSRKVGARVRAGEPFGEIESVKATSELYSGIDGTVAQINTALAENPALINEDPWEKGWLIKIRPDDPRQLEALLSSQDYDQRH